MKEKVDAMYSCADIEGMFVVVVVVIAEVDMSARESKVRDLRAGELYSSQSQAKQSRGSQKSESDV